MSWAVLPALELALKFVFGAASSSGDAAAAAAAVVTIGLVALAVIAQRALVAAAAGVGVAQHCVVYTQLRCRQFRYLLTKQQYLSEVLRNCLLCLHFCVLANSGGCFDKC